MTPDFSFPYLICTSKEKHFVLKTSMFLPSLCRKQMNSLKLTSKIVSKTTYMPSLSQKYFLQQNCQTLWKSIYNGIADSTFIVEIWIAIMKASADALANLLLKIILNLSGIQKVLEVAKMFTLSSSCWQYLFYPKGSQWWTNSRNVWDVHI